MEYISQIRAFYDVLSVKPLSTGQIALWHALMNICNRCFWEEWVTAANITLELSCGLSRQGIFKCRNALKQAGFIDFRTNGTKATAYKMMILYEKNNLTMANSLQAGLQVGLQDSLQAGLQAGCTLIRPKTIRQKTIEKNTLTSIPKEKPPKVNFVKPTIAEIEAHCQERGSNVNATSFFNFYESKGWLIGKNHMKNWKAAVITWEQKNKKDKQQTENPYLRGDLFDNAADTAVISDDIYCLPEFCQGENLRNR